MANTYVRLLYHCIWSTKDRAPLITPAIEDRVWAYIAGIAKENHIHPLRIGGIENHIHALLDLPKSTTVSDAMKQIKGGSSSWINEQKLIVDRFQWQDDYGAFTVSPSNSGRVIEYIANQREHHRKTTFEEEYVAFLRRHGVEYDIQYLFG